MYVCYNLVKIKKVDEIKQAIAEGKYKINVEQLAKRIVQFEGDLFNKRWLSPPSSSPC